MSSALAGVLEEIRDVPLDELDAVDVDFVIAEILRRDADDAVDVARFGSVI